MRRTFPALTVCLLIIVGICFLWLRVHRAGESPKGGTVVPSAKTAAVAAVSPKSTAAKADKLSATNRLAFRLTNTTKTLGQLVHDPHAILLENALIDTETGYSLNIPAPLKSTGNPGSYIVEARGPIDAAFRAVLASVGAQIISYIPNNAYLVKVSAGGAGMLSANTLVEVVLPYEPYYKLSPSLLGLAVEQQPLPPGTALNVELFPGDVAQMEQALENMGVVPLANSSPVASPFGGWVVSVLAPANSLASLAQLPGVKSIGRLYSRQLANDLARVTLGISADTVTSTNYLNLSGLNVTVEVNDSGIDSTHPDFSLVGSAEAPGSVPSTRLIGDAPQSLFDTNGHGTFVAGVIAGNGSESYTVTTPPQGSVAKADFRGKAPAATLYSVGGIAGYDPNFITDQYLQEAPALTNALISNNSWVYAGDYDYDLSAASYDAATRDALPETTGSQPVLFVFAAGDDGGGNDDGGGGAEDTIHSPATAKNVITVGALEELRNITNIVTDANSNQSAVWQPETDSSSQVAAFSSRGNVGVDTEGPYGRFKPDVVAPGTFVVSTRSQQWDTNGYYNATNDAISFYRGQIVETNLLSTYNIAVPPNAVAVVINILTNGLSNPFPTNLPIYVKLSNYPTTNNFDFVTMKDGVSIPPDSGAAIAGIQSIQSSGFYIGIGNNTNVTVNYDLEVQIYTTNDVGNYYQVLEALNDTLAPWYTYGSGTSVAAPSISGMLALIQDYFTNTLHTVPSPALLKAMLINGSRSEGGYSYALTNGINFEGWGLPNIQDAVPFTSSSNSVGSAEVPMFFVDQSLTNALATGDSHTYTVTINPDDFGQFLPLQATLVWTDPPGDPSAAIKLVNTLGLVITNLDTGDVYFGNDILPDVGYNLAWQTNTPPNIDTINNVQNIILPPMLAGSYSVTVVGRAVNVNAVTLTTSNILQDYALVVSDGEGEVQDAFAVTDNGINSQPVTDQQITFVATTNSPLLNQMVGASSPLLGTNTIPLGSNTVWGSNGQITIGQTNQWHFYVVTNTGLTADVTNAAFITFDPYNLSIPRMGVLSDSITNATRLEADIDLYATTDFNLTNLSPVTISNCVNGYANSRASLGAGGTEFVIFSNSAPGTVYYVGVQSQDQMASEYGFLPVFTSTPFGSLGPNGDQTVNGLLLPTLIPDGNNTHPGTTNVFALAIYPMVADKVIVTNLDEHQNFGDLYGQLNFGGQSAVLNNHAGLGDTFGTLPLVYDDSSEPVAGSQHTDKPGNLNNFQGLSVLGPWILNEVDDAPGFTGQVSVFNLLIHPHQDIKQPGIIVAIPPGGWFIDYVDVSPGYTNLTFAATNLPPTIGPPPIQMYELLGAEPTLTSYDQEADLTNCLPGTGLYPAGADPGNIISVGPPLAEGRYFVGLYNPSVSVTANVFISATLGFNSSANLNFDYAATNSQFVINDGVTSSAGVFVAATQTISSVSVGMVVNSPQISDLTFTLVSPTGQRVLLMENRGGASTNGAGATFVYTNVINSTATGNNAANTNYLQVDPAIGGSVAITYDFYSVPDQMTVFAGSNDLADPGPALLFDTGLTNNPTSPVTINVSYPPGTSVLTIIMNEFGNPLATSGDAWEYTAGSPTTNYEYLTFTDDTNLATVPIKYAIPPFDFTVGTSNFTLSDFEQTTNGDYFGPTNIYDPLGGWNVPTNIVTITTVLTNNQFQNVTNVVFLTNNEVSVVTDPYDAVGDNGTNFLALAKGTITRSIPTIPGNTYNVTFWYRGPDITAWWRGEGNAGDSSDPENNGNNGRLVGKFTFPAGEVGQAFGFDNFGNEFNFAGTNAYVQVPQNPSLDVGTGGGFTVEGWINPTNLQPQPLVEWLAHVPTNTLETNIVIEAGPYLNPATGHYYYLLGSTNWTTSELWATELGGHLATINTANEQNWVFDNFASYNGFNHDLWIGLTNSPATTNWSSGETNAYVNWLSGQPDNCLGTPMYTAILGNTNTQPGLWVLADDDGLICNHTTTNRIYGVVEVDAIQTNGVQFWISVTNSPGTTNVLVSSNGCLYANIVDTNFVSHEIYSAPGLLQSNTFQHVALTYDTSNGIAMLYLNGTNVATTNFGSPFVPFVPKTDGDVLLGRDMSPATNNYFGGEMDEMSIYGRPLSAAEVRAIYQSSALTTNRNIGKFDPTVTPAAGLAEALVSFNGVTNVLFGVNRQWLVDSFTFTATSNSMPLQITGLQPGILLDAFSVAEAPVTNIYYLPEQTLDTLTGSPAYGDWTLQVWNNRTDSAVPTQSALLSWELNFILNSNALVSATLTPETPETSTVGAGQTVYYLVTVPDWATYATNILISSSLPVNLLFNPTNLPTGSNPGDQTLLTGSTSGVGTPDINVNIVPPFALPSEAYQTYYLGVQNPGAHAASVELEVNYDITALTNGAPYSAQFSAGQGVRYFSFDVSSNAAEATFQLLHLSSNADLVVSKGTPLPTLTNSDYGSFNVSNFDENIYVLTNSSPVPLSAGTWYLGVIKRDSGVVNYTVLAQELNTNAPAPNIIPLTNTIPFNFTAGPGAALTNFFVFSVTNSFTNTPSGIQTNYVAGVRFELYNLSGNGDLTVQTDAPPYAPPFFQSSQNGGRNPELVLVYTNSALTNLAGDWYLGVPNNATNLITYTIVAAIETNGYFAAFPGATGAGAGAVGAGHAGVTNSTVYHVTTTADSGPGSLRDAVSRTNRTVVFDVSGYILLQSPLLITNSYLTIAGQTAPGQGIMVAGRMTAVQSAHDVIIRDVRFRPGTTNGVAWSNGFEENTESGNIFTPFAGSYFSGWYVDAGSVDVLKTGYDGSTAYEGVWFIDLDGSNPGTIHTNIPTIPGQAYTLSFAYSRNDAGPVPFANILINSNLLATIAASQNSSWANMEWAPTSFVFTATSPLTQLKFQSPDPAGNAAGVLLDAISVAINTTNANGSTALQMTNTLNVIMDHISTSWSARNLVSVLGSTNVTVQWSIMSDSIYSTNSQQSFGSVLGQGNGALSFNHNLYADNYSGNPRLGDNLSLDFVNNVVYNWGLFSGLSDGTNALATSPNGATNQLNYVGNYLIAGTNTAVYGTNYAITNIAFFGGFTNANVNFATWIFQTNNFIDSNTNGILDGADTRWAMFTNVFTEFNQPFPLPAVPTDEAFLAYEKVLDFAGVNLDKRDIIDTNIVFKVRQQTGTLINSVAAIYVPGSTLPYLDTDQDGIPDFWESTFTTNLLYVPSNNNDRDGDGYTDLEEYDNWLAGPHALTVTNTTIGVDLKQMFGKTGNLSFAVTNGIHGTVYLTNALVTVTNIWGTETNIVIGMTNTTTYSNSFAVFTPTNYPGSGTNYSGYASFDVFVTNNDTLAYFGPVTVSAVVSAVPIATNLNVPPVIITLTNAIPYTNSNFAGVDYYQFMVPTNTAFVTNTGVVFQVLAPNAPVTLVARYGLPLPSLSSYDYISANPATAADQDIVVTTNSQPVVFTNGTWYLAVVNVSGGPVKYAAEATLFTNVGAPFFLFPTNTDSFTNIGTATFTTNLLAVDTNMPPLPLTFALISGPTGISITDVAPSNGLITWTPTGAQEGTNYAVAVSVSNGAYTITNTFNITVEVSNLPPIWNNPNPPNQVITYPATFIYTNGATNPNLNLPIYPLVYSFLSAPDGALLDTNTGIITWTLTAAETNGIYWFTNVVTDTNPPAVNATSLSVTNSFYVQVLQSLVAPGGAGGGLPDTNSVAAGTIYWYTVTVPTNATLATNILLFATNQPVNVWFSTNAPPTITGGGDVDLLPASSGGTNTLSTNSAPASIVPGGTYYLGVQNTGSQTVGYALVINFNSPATLIAIPNFAVMPVNLSSHSVAMQWSAPTNQQFQVEWATNLTPVIHWTPFPEVLTSTNGTFNFTDTNALSILRFYRLILLP